MVGFWGNQGQVGYGIETRRSEKGFLHHTDSMMKNQIQYFQ
jgi:hypothetical protein